jgi:putative phosphoserine phosphatase/1-acylglycerol-3-phosphate O-acyltransferase
MTTLQAHVHDIEAEAAGPVVAFFDLDRTLIAGYSILAIAMETVRRGAARGELRQALKILHSAVRERADHSGGNYHRLVRRLSRALTGVSEQTLVQLGDSAWHNSLARSLYSEAVTVVEAHRRAGHHLVIVTAASRYQVEPVARVLGIDEICCTRLEVVEGRFTGRVIAPLCYGEGKALAARSVVRRKRSSLRRAWFYSDSSADLPLLRKVGHPVAVNASERLRGHAGAEGWPLLDFRSRGGPLVTHMARTALTLQTVVASSALGAVSRRLGADRRSSANRITRLLGDLGSGVAGLDLEVEGREHLQPDRPAIYIFNHQSLLDALVLARLLRGDAVALCKKEMADNPLMGPLLRQVDTIFVDRDEADQAAVLQRALQVLRSGRSLVIAPEGTRSTLGNIQPFKLGAFLLARKARVPIVPIVLHNVKDALPKGGLLIRPTAIRVSVLPPLEPEQMGQTRQLCHQIESRYCELLGRSQPAALPWQARS